MTLKARIPALLCVLILLLCALAAYPVAEMGMVDDFSYVKTAEVLAQTGHLVYNGWTTAMLGWQLYFGALFVWLFGASFTAARASTFVVALATAFLTHRILARSGLNARFATLGTLAFVLSPLFLPLALSFMSDIGGIFCIVLCLYACLRAVQARSDGAALGWLIFAALSNALGGTVRQIAWLGVLVMVPSTVWLLRRRPRVVVSGVALYAISAAIIFGSMRWFQHQPYSVPEPLIPEHIHARGILVQCSRALLGLSMFLTPVLLAFAAARSLRNRLSAVVMASAGLVCAGAILFLHHKHKLSLALAPYTGDWLTKRGLIDSSWIKGTRPTVLGPGACLCITLAMVAALVCFFCFLLSKRRWSAPSADPAVLPWPTLLILIGPFTLAYLGLLLPRAAGGHQIFDRYLLPLILVSILLLMRLFQDRAQPDPPWISWVLVGIVAAFAVAGTHDAFSMYRGWKAAVDELRAAGVNDSAIDAGYEFNYLTEIERAGHVNEPRVKIPANGYAERVSEFPEYCRPGMEYTAASGKSLTRAPDMVPGYALSYDPGECGGSSGFAPVTYQDWLGEHTIPVYIVRTLRTEKPSP